MCTRYPIINRVSELKVHIELTRFVQPEKIEIDANERAVNKKSQYCFFVCTTFDSFLNDLLILCICSILGLYNDSWIILAAASILWVRILWQFRFHRKTDGRLILMLLLDNPVIALGNENDADFTYEKDVLIWKVFQVIGVLVEIAVVVFWGIPFVLSIYTNLFV